MQRPDSARIWSYATHGSERVSIPEGATEQDFADGTEIVPRLYAYLAATETTLLRFVALKLIALWTPEVVSFEQSFQSYCTIPRTVYAPPLYLERDWEGTDAVRACVRELEGEGLIREGRPDQMSHEEGVLNLTQDWSTEDSIHFCLTEKGAAEWLHIEKDILNAEFHAFGWSEYGYVCVSTRPPCRCLFGDLIDECNLFSCTESGPKQCRIDYVPKWRGSWWRPIVPGYVILCPVGKTVMDPAGSISIS